VVSAVNIQVKNPKIKIKSQLISREGTIHWLGKYHVLHASERAPGFAMRNYGIGEVDLHGML